MKKQKILSIILSVILLSTFFFSASSLATNVEVNNEDNSNTENDSNEEDNNQQNTISQETLQMLDELNKQKDEAQESLQKVTEQLEYVQEEMSAILLEIQRLDDKIREYESQNSTYEEKLQELQKSVEETTIKLNTVTEDYNKKKEQLKNRLVALYEAGDIAYLDVLLSAESLSDFLSIYYIMVQIAEYDNALIDKVEEEKNEIDVTKRKLENETSQMRILKAQVEQSEVILKNTKTLQEGYIDQLSEEEKQINDKIQEYKDDTARIEAKMQELQAYNGQIDIQFTGGTMIWPVAISGTGISSYYGTREHPIEGIVKFHQGLDIANTGYGAPVVATADGIVTYAGELGSYGNCVMVYHGDGLTTLYGHGQEILTSRGTEVKQGDLIMRTGSTGNSTGPHLHFEVRLNGSTTNPLNYVKAP